MVKVAHTDVLLRIAPILPMLLLGTTQLDVISLSAPRLEGRMLGTDVILDGLGRHNVGIGALDHLVGVNALVTRDIDWQRVVSQGFHLVNGQVAIRLVAQCVVFT